MPGHDYSRTEVLTMDYVDVVCNGKQATSSTSQLAQRGAAMNQLNEPNQKYRTPAASLNWLIYMLFARQEYVCCKDIIEQQLKDSFDKEYLYYIKGQIARLEGAQQDSLYFLQQAIELNPANYENYKEIGITLYGLGRWKQSLEAFTKAESLLPRPDPQVYHFIGDLLYRNIDHANRPGGPAMNSNITAAKEYFNRAIQNGKPIESFQRLATIYREESNYAKAIEMLESTLQIIPDHAETLTDIGILYLKINDTKSAFDKLFEVTKLNENCGRALIALGAILQSKNDVDGALNKYKLINATKEDTNELWNNIGLCFYKKRKFIAAIACLKKAVWISPLNFSCLYNLGLVYLTAHQYASAYYTFASAINLRPDHAECYMLLGICLKNLGDPQNAYLAFERSTMLPDAIKNPLIYLNFAIHCYELERHELARQFLQNFLDMIAHIKIRTEYAKVANQLMKRLPEPEQETSVIDEAAVVADEVHNFAAADDTELEAKTDEEQKNEQNNDNEMVAA